MVYIIDSGIYLEHEDFEGRARWGTTIIKGEPDRDDFGNGTHVAGPEATEWTQLEPGVAHPLSDGDRLLLGWTVITFEQQPD